MNNSRWANPDLSKVGSAVQLRRLCRCSQPSMPTRLVFGNHWKSSFYMYASLLLGVARPLACIAFVATSGPGARPKSWQVLSQCWLKSKMEMCLQLCLCSCPFLAPFRDTTEPLQEDTLNLQDPDITFLLPLPKLYFSNLSCSLSLQAPDSVSLSSTTSCVCQLPLSLPQGLHT